MRHLKLSHLRRIVRESIREVLIIDEAAFRVSYTAKDGKPETRVFPSQAVADMYARSVRGAKVEPVDMEVKDVGVQKVPEATLDDLRTAAKTFYLQTKKGDKFDPRPAPTVAKKKSAAFADKEEHAAELDMEAWGAARAAGLAPDDAWKEVEAARGSSTMKKTRR